MATERLLPAVLFSIPARGPGRPIARAVPAVVTKRPAPAAARTTRRNEPLLGTPVRAGLLIGVSAAVYAVTLAGVAALQSGTDAETAAGRQPLIAALADRRQANDGLEAELASLNARLSSLGTAYDTTGQLVSAYESRLDSLATLVAEVRGSARSGAAGSNARTVTLNGTSSTATTAATSTTSAAAPVTTSVVKPVAAVAAAPASKPPATTATTAASGKP